MQGIWLLPGNLSWILQIGDLSSLKDLDHQVGNIEHSYYRYVRCCCNSSVGNMGLLVLLCSVVYWYTTCTNGCIDVTACVGLQYSVATAVAAIVTVAALATVVAVAAEAAAAAVVAGSPGASKRRPENC